MFSHIIILFKSKINRHERKSELLGRNIQKTRKKEEIERINFIIDSTMGQSVQNNKAKLSK